MRDRITQKDLEAVVARINKVTNSPSAYATKDVSTSRSWCNVGHYHIDGTKLIQTCNNIGGITVISTSYPNTKRELYNWMQAFLAGIAVETC